MNLPAFHILLVEDDPKMPEILAALLHDDNITVQTEPTGAEALKYARENRLDLILLDLGLPMMSGEEFALHYRAQPGPHAPIVLLTAAMDSADSAERVGAAARLEKPFDLDQLLALVSRFSPATD